MDLPNESQVIITAQTHPAGRRLLGPAPSEPFEGDFTVYILLVNSHPGPHVP